MMKIVDNNIVSFFVDIDLENEDSVEPKAKRNQRFQMKNQSVWTKVLKQKMLFNKLYFQGEKSSPKKLKAQKVKIKQVVERDNRGIAPTTNATHHQPMLQKIK